MRRQKEREASPVVSKRLRNDFSRYDAEKYETLGRDGRMSSKSISARSNYNRNTKDDEYIYDYATKTQEFRFDSERSLRDRLSGSRRPDVKQGDEFKVLSINVDNSELSDNAIKDKLYTEFERYGDFHVNIIQSGEGRIAFINFRHCVDAKSAYEIKRHQALLNSDAILEPVIMKSKPQYFSSTEHRASNRQNRFKKLRGSRNVSNGPLNRQIRETREPMRTEFKKQHRFPNHLVHVEPEDDETATRTLFVGNLENDVSDSELRNAFGKYGHLEDIDIKRPDNTNAYAFVKFSNLDMAHKAKVAMSGQYIRNNPCRIGYGKVQPSTCVWVGGLGPWVSVDLLEREFDRFGAIQRIEWQKDDSYAFVLYASIDAAKAACQGMRGFVVDDAGHRLRVDYADDENPLHFSRASRDRERKISDDVPIVVDVNNLRNDVKPVENSTPKSNHNDSRRSKSSVSPHGRDIEKRTEKRSSPCASNNISTNNKEGEERKTLDASSKGQLCCEVTKNSLLVWNGAFMLKNSAFAVNMYLLSGEKQLVDTMMPQSCEMEPLAMLKITQRLRMDQPKLDDFMRRIATASSSSCCVLLAIPSVLVTEEAEAAVSRRPLRNLVCYLKQKEAAGVVPLQATVTGSKDSDLTGVLHAFPPSPVAHDILTKYAPSGTDIDRFKDDHVVVVLLKDGS